MRVTTDEIISLVNQFPNDVDFGTEGNGTSDEWLTKVEEQLGFALPDSYKWFCKTLAGGQIRGDEIYSLYYMDYDQTCVGDIRYVYFKNREQGIFSPEKLLICDNGDEVFYFEVTELDEFGEYPVFRLDYIEGSTKLYATNFLEFLKKRIEWLAEG